MREKLIDSCTKWLIMDMLTHGYIIKVELNEMSTFKLGLLRIVMPIAKRVRALINKEIF